MGVSLADCVTVTDLPEDVVHHILGFLAPRDICTFASLSPNTQRILQDASIWSQVAHRQLRIQPATISSTGSTSALSVSNVEDLKHLVDQLMFHWHVSIGVLIAGVALHRRTGFSQVTPRGGVELKLSDSSSDSAYVFAGSFAHLAVPNASPALVLSFSMHEDGPFPTDGMRLRLMHAAEPATKQAPESVESTSVHNAIPDNPNKVTFHASTHPNDTFGLHAKISITLNGHPIHHQLLSPSFDFELTQLHIPAHLLVTAPAINVLAVEYDRSSTAGYWLRDVTLAPTIATLPPPPENFPLPLPDRSTRSQSDVEIEGGQNVEPQSLPQSRVHIQFHVENPPPRRRHPHPRHSSRRSSHHVRSPHMPRSPRSPRTPRASRQHSPRSPPHVSVQNMAPLMLDGLSSSQARRDHLQQQQQAIKPSRMPKHMYHNQNHSRSPRIHHATRARAQR